MNRSRAQILLAISICVSGCNPFAPALEDGDPFADMFGDPTTVEGFFMNFRSAYELRDISMYENLLDSSFVFIYRDFDQQIDRQWGFSQDLATTRRMFDNSTTIRLQWNQMIAHDAGDDGRTARIIRSFNLSVNLEDGEVFHGDGNVNFQLARPDSTESWRLIRWRDESEF